MVLATAQPAHAKQGEEGSPAQPRGTRSPRAAVPKSRTSPGGSAGRGNTPPTCSRTSAPLLLPRGRVPAGQAPAQRSNHLPPCTSPRAGLGTDSARGSPALVAQDSRSGTPGAQLVSTAPLPGQAAAGRRCLWLPARGPAPFRVPAPGAGSVAGRELVAGTTQWASEPTLCRPALSGEATDHTGTPRHGACDVGPRSLSPTGSWVLLLP